jgi:hypothetical protein
MPNNPALATHPERRRMVYLGLFIQCFLPFKGKPFMVQPDDKFDDYGHGQERTQSDPQALLRKESRAAAGRCE